MRCRGPNSGVAPIKLIMLVAAVGMIVGGGVFAWNRVRGTATEGETGDGEEAAAEEGAEAVPTQTVALGEFLVNLQTADGTLRYLQTDISLVIAAPEGEESGGHGGHGEAAELELAPASQRFARDVAIQVLSSQSFEKLRDDPDRNQLKSLLQQRLDDQLASYRVMDVLFTAFVMQ